MDSFFNIEIFKILYKHSKHLLLVINEHKQLTETMATRFENPKLLSTESDEKYIADMSDLAPLVGIEDT